MAAVLRTGVANLGPKALIGGLCKGTLKRHNALVVQVSFISGRELRKNRPPKPPPFDWRNKEYTRWYYMTDPIEARLDENSKVIVVEGLPGVGKDKFAKKLAEELEMKYFKPPSFDELYVNPYGFDLRSLNPKLPENIHFYDVKSFLENPSGVNTAAYQLMWFQLRARQYMDAICDVLCSGQGAVIQRSPFSDPNFMDAMFQQGWVSRGAQHYYKTAVLAVNQELVQPHLVVYLDAPISVIKDNIKKRNIPYEVNSKAFSEKYLQDLDRIYKEYLRDVTKHCHLLMYDWSREGDVDVVVEDIERLDFDNVPHGSEKFRDWRYDHISVLKLRRGDYSDYREQIMGLVHIANFDVPEMFTTAEENIILDELLEDVPSAKYMSGFNPELDKGVLFKTKHMFEDDLPRGKLAKKE